MNEFNDATDEVTESQTCRIDAMPKEIAKALLQVKGGVKQLVEDDENKFANFKYASVDKFYAAVRPLMVEAGLDILVDEVDMQIRPGSKDAPWVMMKYELWYLHASGVMFGPYRRHIMQALTGPQNFGALESYVRKAFMRGQFQIPTGEKDADAEAPREDGPVSKPQQRNGNTSKFTPSTKKPTDDMERATARWYKIRNEIDRADNLKKLNSTGINSPERQADERLIRAQASGDLAWQKLVNHDERKRKLLEEEEQQLDRDFNMLAAEETEDVLR